MQESQFIGRLRSGEQGAYRELLSLYSDKVYNTALGLLQNREDAEDITQEVFAEIFRSVKGFREDSRFSTWIYRIAVTKSLELMRSRQRGKRQGFLVSLFGREQEIVASPPEPFCHPGVALERKETASVLFTAIRRLPYNQQTAFTLHKLENLSYAEIAEVMNTSVSSVESLMFRAKRNLREMLEKYYEQNMK